MASKLDICNSALIELGGLPLVNIADGSKQGTLLEAQFNPCKDYVLREHNWKSAIKRVSLSPLVGTPLAIPDNIQQYQYIYQLPSDYLRPALNDDSKIPPFVIEGQTFLCNIQNAVMRYVYSVPEDKVQQLDSHLAETIAMYLASKIAMSLIQNTQVVANVKKDYQIKLSRAKFIDSSTTKPIIQQEFFLEDARLQANHL